MDKKDVIKITLELIKEKKLEKTSIGEIVKKLDSSPGNLYYHFRSKNDIYKEVLDYSLEEITRYLNRVKTVRNKKNSCRRNNRYKNRYKTTSGDSNRKAGNEFIRMLL